MVAAELVFLLKAVSCVGGNERRRELFGESCLIFIRPPEVQINGWNSCSPSGFRYIIDDINFNLKLSRFVIH